MVNLELWVFFVLCKISKFVDRVSRFSADTNKLLCRCISSLLFGIMEHEHQNPAWEVDKQQKTYKLVQAVLVHAMKKNVQLGTSDEDTGHSLSNVATQWTTCER